MSTAGALTAGRHWPLGAHCERDGINFAVYSQHAALIELCLFGDDGRTETARCALPVCTDGVWHGFLPGGRAGQLYGYRVHGPFAPQRGHRFNPAKLLVDPYARELVGGFEWHPAVFGYPEDGVPDHLRADARDSADWVPKARVTAGRFDWEGDRLPATPLADTVLYEAHVRGFTQLHPEVPEALRGTYAGLASPAPIAHLRALGVTALSLLPVHYAVDEARLARSGLRNYWGYNTLGFFAPNPRYCSGAGGRSPTEEFKAMVRDLHAAGIEVILDVVYNHSAESDEWGPTLSLRGIDNASYYRLQSADPALYENFSGCGNSLRTEHPRVLQLVMDSLRYWVEEMHVDGFRFDLGVSLARGPQGFDQASAFCAAVRQDPVLARTKLIAEPWDLGPDGYRAGQFPAGWSEWNDSFRDGCRGFWLRGSAGRGELAGWLCASSGRFRHDRRAPQASVNFIAAHDGFTLEDLVSYDHKHNEANLEQNRDGHDDNSSWNCGVEGPSDNAVILALRGRLKRALLATLLLAQGVPMLLAGDELGRSQQGNNNSYCQDGPLNWLDWSQADRPLIAFVTHLLALRARLPQLRSTRWLTGLADAQGERDIVWINAEGEEMQDAEWQVPGCRYLAWRLAGRHGAPDCLVICNGESTPSNVRLPAGAWQVVLDTASADGRPPDQMPSRRSRGVAARSIQVLIVCASVDGDVQA